MTKHFFCYSPTLHKFVQSKFKLKYICAAINEKDGRKFWLYEKTESFNKALSEYHNLFKGGDVN
jgi:hypothetical protein